jgi:hypothetical protein
MRPIERFRHNFRITGINAKLCPDLIFELSKINMEIKSGHNFRITGINVKIKSECLYA